MPKQNRAFLDATVSYSAGTTQAEELTRGGLVLGYLCRLTGQLTLAGANNTAAKTLRGDALAVMRKLRIRVNSTEHAVEHDPVGIILDNWYTLGKWPRDLLGLVGDGSAVNPSFDISFVIPFQFPRRKVQVPIEFALDARANRMSKLEVEVEWGSHTDINADATGFTVAPRLEVTALQSFGIPAEIAVGFIRRYKIQQTLSATNPREQIRLPTSHTYHGMILNATDAAVDDVAVFNRIRLLSNATVFEDWDPEVLNDAYGRLWHGREGRQDEFFTSTQFNPLAYYPIEIPYDGNTREMLVAAQLAELILECDCTIGGGATVLSSYNFQYVPPIAARG